jgi:hypothetical protein
VAGVRKGPPATLHTSHTSTTARPPAHHPHCTPSQSTCLAPGYVPPGASPAWDAGLCPGLAWAVAPARGREKSRGPRNRPLNSPSYRGGHAKKVPDRAPTYYDDSGQTGADTQHGSGTAGHARTYRRTRSNDGYGDFTAEEIRLTRRNNDRTHSTDDGKHHCVLGSSHA